ncbi:MAG: carboxymuconolactone decarboxylase family protein [Novosphingobium sp.]|nr:carboxymuconolactone decarboxylase family protein [Novosphingobium sp.]
MIDLSGSQAATAAREQEVVGQAPRIPPVDREANAEAVIAPTGRLREAIVGKDAPPMTLDQIPEIMFTMCRWPELWERYMAVSIHLQGPQGRLEPRDRQLAILRTAWLLQAPFEWGEHVKTSKRVGITGEEVERVITGSSAPGWSAHDAAILRAAEELRERVMVSDETWSELGQKLDDGQCVELLILIGQFTTTAYFQNSLRLQLEPGSEGLSAR